MLKSLVHGICIWLDTRTLCLCHYNLKITVMKKLYINGSWYFYLPNICAFGYQEAQISLIRIGQQCILWQVVVWMRVRWTACAMNWACTRLHVSRKHTVINLSPITTVHAGFHNTKYTATSRLLNYWNSLIYAIKKALKLKWHVLRCISSTSWRHKVKNTSMSRKVRCHITEIHHISRPHADI